SATNTPSESLSCCSPAHRLSPLGTHGTDAEAHAHVARQESTATPTLPGNLELVGGGMIGGISVAARGPVLLRGRPFSCHQTPPRTGRSRSARRVRCSSVSGGASLRTR